MKFLGLDIFFVDQCNKFKMTVLKYIQPQYKKNLIPRRGPYTKVTLQIQRSFIIFVRIVGNFFYDLLVALFLIIGTENAFMIWKSPLQQIFQSYLTHLKKRNSLIAICFQWMSQISYKNWKIIQPFLQVNDLC